MSRKEKTEWFQKHKRANEGKVGTFKRKEFEHVTNKEMESNGARNEDYDLDDWLPYSRWCVLQQAQGVKTADMPNIWAQLMGDPNVRKRQHESGAMLIYDFGGQQTKRGRFEEIRSDTSRKAVLESVQDCPASFILPAQLPPIVFIQFISHHNLYTFPAPRPPLHPHFRHRG